MRLGRGIICDVRSYNALLFCSIRRTDNRYRSFSTNAEFYLPVFHRGDITIRLVVPGRATIPAFVSLGEIRALMCPECPARPLNAFASSLGVLPLIGRNHDLLQRIQKILGYAVGRTILLLKKDFTLHVMQSFWRIIRTYSLILKLFVVYDSI